VIVSGDSDNSPLTHLAALHGRATNGARQSSTRIAARCILRLWAGVSSSCKVLLLNVLTVKGLDRQHCLAALGMSLAFAAMRIERSLSQLRFRSGRDYPASDNH
jgi:hypothetical protein